MLKKSFEQDEQDDLSTLNKVMNKEAIEIAKHLSDKFSSKYGHEFGGYVKVQFNVVDQVFVLECGSNYKETIEQGDFLQIPARLRFYREIVKSKKKN